MTQVGRDELAAAKAARLSKLAVRELDPAATHGYGIRWDPAARCYRVRDEPAGTWLRDGDGAIRAFVRFDAANSEWRRLRREDLEARVREANWWSRWN
ncbi:hypothetical protein [Kitasatospora aureofaciens]|uniref:hypothetical protein n=1 Tax=Kitasatospora aureofaciens TaxID=1894 RepID=UPI001C482CAC|nr:hypothetical protein [Kitasatospora aureofaciens]MBV6696041.1 hypothetical protein [Kitasatospora aureofaciens]MBV6696044.1 hypothetical protein [Kitasatospora aureofaciens]